MSTMLETPLDAEAAFEAAVTEGVFTAYLAEGYVETDDDGQTSVDKAALHEAIYAALKKNAIVKHPKERSEVALGKGALTKLVFPKAPGAHDEWDELDTLQRAVWEELVKGTWNPTNPNFSGPVQRLVERDDKLILIRTRTTVDGTPSVDCVYLTALEELIFSDFVDPLKDSVRKAAERLAKNAAMVSKRNKLLAPKASREVESGMRAAASLAKSTLELMSGSTGPNESA
jgi:hypothetical protein